MSQNRMRGDNALYRQITNYILQLRVIRIWQIKAIRSGESSVYPERSGIRHGGRIGTLLAALAAASAAGMVAGDIAAAAGEVNIYSYRKERLIKPQLDSFSAATGIAYNLVTGKADALAQRIKAEGRNSPADVLLTVDAGRLVRAKRMGIVQAVRSAVLEDSIPARFRDPEGYWFGLGIRARTIFYATDRVKPEALSSYEALAGAQWKGRVLIRSSSNIYNQSLMASLIHHHDIAKAQAWAAAMVANFARRPQGGDTDQLRALAAGVGDVAIANHYYYVRLLTSKRPRDREIVAKVKPFWPNQKGRGVHLNISGAAVTRYAKNRAAAIRLIEYLAGPAAQRLYASVAQEFPVRDGVAPSAAVASLGTFNGDPVALRVLGENNAEAVRIFDRVGWR